MTQIGPETELLDDTGSGQYKVTKKELEDLVEFYRQRKYVEDIDYIQGHLKGMSSLLDALDVNPDQGLTTTSITSREAHFGTHYKEPPTRTPFLKLLIAALDDMMMKILMVCAVVSMVVDWAQHKEGGAPWYVEGLAVWAAVAVVSLVGAISDYQKEGEFLKKQLIEENTKVVHCMRDSKEEVVHRNFLKVGDVIKLQNGMNVPVDGLVIGGVGIMADESAMTGESDHLPKESVEKCLQRQAEHEEQNRGQRSHHDVPSPVLLSGTQIQTGQGWFLCIVVGDMTCEGQILSSLESDANETTPLQGKLEVIARDIGKLGMLAALLIFHALLLRQFGEALFYRRFDLGGGPRMWYRFDLENNLSGMFGAQIPKACETEACRSANPNTGPGGHELVGNPAYAAYADTVAGQCGQDPSKDDHPLSGAEEALELQRRQDPYHFQRILDAEIDGCSGQLGVFMGEWLSFVTAGVAIIVVAVPEGLPLAVMISLAYSIKKMLVDQNFVKRLNSCEIMGGANNICSDKTGTLTKNIMTLTQIWAGVDRQIENADNEKADGRPADDFPQPLPFIRSKTTQALLAEAISCNTTGDCDDAVASEMAMLKFVRRCGVDFHYLRQKYLPRDLTRFVFDPVRKRMSTVIDLEDDEVEYTEFGYEKRLHVKGASEIVLDTCQSYLDEDGIKQPLDGHVREELNELIARYAKSALRTFAFAYKDLQENEGGPLHENRAEGAKCYEIEGAGLTLICVAGIKDIIREEVPEAVAKCNLAGVRVRMVTGDNKITAIAIAKECGIINEGEEFDNPNVCMEGPEFNEFVGSLVNRQTKERISVMGKDPDLETIGNMENMKVVRSKLKVLARSRPNDKYIMVFGLKQLGDIVAVTGDGTNDAPALKKADVGFAMKTGTQVAHTAADIIIQDDNFASIVKACKWGRNVYDNIRRFLQFQLTVNLVALITSFFASVVMKDPPLKPVQLLWVNMIMDSLASLALATELPVDALLNRPPYRRREYIISRRMVKHILGQAIFQASILFVFVFGGSSFIYEDQNMPGIYKEIKNGLYVHDGRPYTNDLEPHYKKYSHLTPSRHLSIVFNVFVWLQVFNMLCARKINDEFNFLEGVHTNGMFLGVLAFIAGLQVFIMNCGPIVGQGMAAAFSVHVLGLTSYQWTVSILVGLCTFPINFFLKLVPDTWCFILGDEPEDDVLASKADYQELLSISAKYTFREASSTERKDLMEQELVELAKTKPGDSLK